MILKKQEKNGVIKAIYSSSNICASTYESKTNTLTIIFSNGGQYQYTNVPEKDYMRFEIADSQGAVFNSHIKTHPFTKLDKVDTKTILTEVNEYKTAENDAKIAFAVKTMVDKMRDIVTYYDTTGNVESGLLTKTKVSISLYETAIESKLDKVNG